MTRKELQPQKAVSDLTDDPDEHLTGLASALYEITDPMLLLHRVVDQLLTLVQRATGAAVGLVDEGRIACVSAAGTLAAHSGTVISLGQGLSGLSVMTGQAFKCDDSETDDRVDQADARRIGARSGLCVPLMIGPRAVGLLVLTSAQPHAFTDRDLAVIRHVSPFLAATAASASDLSHMARPLLETWPIEDSTESPGRAEVAEFLVNILQPGIGRDVLARERIRTTLDGCRIAMVCQPIIDLTDDRLVGAEALARFDPVDGRIQPPDVWFADAHRVGLGIELELAAMRVALAVVPDLPDHIHLAVNIGPSALAAPDVIQLLDTTDPERIVIELTEHVAVDDYPGLRHTLSTLRARGVRLAIDDTGAGVSSLAHILRLAPEFIKLDRELTLGIEGDPARRALAAALVNFAADSGAEIVAEGIETTDALNMLRELGINYGQGFHIGIPAPIDTLQTFRPKAAQPGSA